MLRHRDRAAAALVISPGEAPTPDFRPADVGALLAQQAAVAEMAQRALSGTDVQALLDEACRLVASVLDVELVDVLRLDDDGEWLTVVAGLGWHPGIVAALRVRAGRGSQAGFTMATGEPVIVDDFGTESRFEVATVLQEHGARSGISVRIGAAERPYGVLACFARRAGAFSSDDASFLQSMANVLGSAVARLLAEDDLRRSRDELATIVGNVADGISVQAPDGKVIFANDAAARMTGFDTGADFVNAERDDYMSRFELLEEDGSPLAIERLPGRVAFATGRPTEPTLLRFRIRATGEERWSMIQASPVHDADGRVVQVINIFRDVTTAHRAEMGQRLLANAAAALSSTLDVDEAARRLASLCVPQLADYCVVDLLEPGPAMRSAAIAHVEPERRRTAWRLREMRPHNMAAEAGPPAVVRNRRAELIAELPPGMVEQTTDDPEQRALLANLQLSSYLCVPLMARGRAIGALTLVHAESQRRFDEADLRLAEEMGTHAGVAIENAQLYRAVETRRSELDAVLAAMDDAVLFFDSRGTLRLSNRSAAALFDRRVPGTIAELRAALDPVADEASHQRAAAEGGTGGDDPATLAGQHRLADPGRWLEVKVYRTGIPSRLGPAPSVVVLRDVTSARAAALARDAFMGVLSHELRTPITTIYGGSELLERGLAPDKAADVVRDIRTEAERLTRLVEDLLVMSRVERGGVEIGDEPVLIQRVVPAVVESVRARWPALAVTLALDEALPAVRGEVTYVEQVLRNLLTNAVRYGDALHSGVEVRVTAEDASRQVAVRVLDRGEGLGSGESLDRLFELFYRAPAARRVPGGAGIGLFVCRQLVEAMGGRIWARSRPEGGAEFGFTLPAIDTDSVA